MIDFIKWCEEKKLPLDAATNEATRRTGAKEGLYPAQYYGGQYTGLSKTPSAADAAYYQSINNQKK